MQAETAWKNARVPEDIQARFGEFDDDIVMIDRAIQDAEVRFTMLLRCGYTRQLLHYWPSPVQSDAGYELIYWVFCYVLWEQRPRIGLALPQTQAP